MDFLYCLNGKEKRNNANVFNIWDFFPLFFHIFFEPI